MDQQHPVPQQISSYQFRLVGDMTLKQFFQIGAGALVSLLIYATGLHPVIKWPLIIFFFSMGAALAFLPFEERPLSKWIFSFFRSVYSPTLYVWKKSPTGYNFYAKEETTPESQAVVNQVPKGTEAYLSSLPEQKVGFMARLEDSEKGLLGKISTLFSGIGAAAPPVPDEVSQPSVKVESKTKPIDVPKTNVPQIAQKGFRPKIVIEEKPLKDDEPKEAFTEDKVNPTLTEDSIKAQMAEYSLEASPPSPPTIPNTVVGQVVDKKGKIIDGAILEIRDMAGRPVRALRSNKVGHFMIVTSLSNGTYSVVTEKEGYQFDPITVEAKGDIVLPVVIRAINTLDEN